MARISIFSLSLKSVSFICRPPSVHFFRGLGQTLYLLHCQYQHTMRGAIQPKIWSVFIDLNRLYLITFWRGVSLMSNIIGLNSTSFGAQSMTQEKKKKSNTQQSCLFSDIMTRSIKITHKHCCMQL